MRLEPEATNHQPLTVDQLVGSSIIELFNLLITCAPAMENGSRYWCAELSFGQPGASFSFLWATILVPWVLRDHGSSQKDARGHAGVWNQMFNNLGVRFWELLVHRGLQVVCLLGLVSGPLFVSIFEAKSRRVAFFHDSRIASLRASNANVRSLFALEPKVWKGSEFWKGEMDF